MNPRSFTIECTGEVSGVKNFKIREFWNFVLGV